MIIAVTSLKEGIKSEIDDRFGRAEYFTLISIGEGKDEVYTIQNEAKNDAGGAGGKAVRILYQNKVEAVITGEFGPKAMDALKAFDIKGYRKGAANTVEEAIKLYKDGKLEIVDTATAPEHNGLRRA